MKIKKPGIVVHTYNLNTFKIKASGSAIQGYPQLHNQFEATLGLQETLSCLCVCAYMYVYTCRYMIPKLC